MSATPSIQSTAPTFSIAHLRAAYTAMLAEAPERAPRLDRALATVVACSLERFTFRPGCWHVQSCREADTRYTVVPLEGRLICNCPDAEHRGLPCRHTLAVEMYERAERLDADEQAPADEPIGYELTAQGLAALAAPASEPSDAA